MEKHEHFQITYQQLQTEQSKYCRETTLLLILKGQMFITVNEERSHLTAGHLFAINADDLILQSPIDKQACLYVEVQISSLFFVSQFPAFFYTRFECQPKQNEQGKMTAIAMLRKQVAELCVTDFAKDEAQTLKSSLALCQIILLLVEYFQKEQKSLHLHSDNQKLQRILEYIEAHYRKNITLLDVAEAFFMSESSLSKFFKAETGEYFSDYLRTLRVQHSVTELLYTKKSIEQIALDNGFNNSKTYRQHFKQLFNQSPTLYRASHLTDTQQASQKVQASTDTLHSKEILMSLYRYTQEPLDEHRSSNLSIKSKQLLITAENQHLEKAHAEIIIHIGCLETLALKDTQEEILLLKKQATIKYISVNALFSSVPASFYLYKETKMNSFPQFGALDLVLSFLEKEQLALFIQLPLQIQNQTQERIKKIYVEFFKHVRNQYGKQMIKNWKINCLFNKHYPTAEIKEFLKLRHYLKDLSSFFDIGAECILPDPFLTTEEKDTQSFFEKIAPSCDFISFKAEPNYIFHSTQQAFSDLEIDHQYVINKTTYLKLLMKEYGVRVPLYLSEWNTLTGITKDINGIFFRGALVLSDLLALDTLVTGYGFWLNISLYENNQQSYLAKNDSLELFHYYSSKRPAFFCLALVQRVKGEILAKGNAFLLTKNQENYQLLLWNCNYFDPHLSSEEAFLKSQIASFDLAIANLNSQRFQIKQIEFDRHHGALFYSYEKFNQAAALDMESQKYIQQITHPKIKVFDTDITDYFSYYVTLDTNAVILLELTPIN